MTEIHLKGKLTHESTAEEVFETILKSRGYHTSLEQENFLHPPLPTLEYLLSESKLSKSKLLKAKKVLDAHLSANHDLCIFGDYDADGVTSTAIMWQAITAYAKKNSSTSRILPFIPDRHIHGYGLSAKAVEDVISGEGFTSSSYPNFSPKLIITVDTGIVAHAGVATFSTKQMDVIITDHHLPLDSGLPEAAAIVHTTSTSGAGVAWIFALYLLGSPANKLIDLATIGIVADMMPLVEMNRSICVAGLKALSSSSRPGLIAMKTAMGVSTKMLSTYDISFGIAPRINAAGRIYSPMDALRLLCIADKTVAQELGKKIEAHNRDRQEYTDRALKIAAGKTSQHKIIVLIGDYHEGVIGLVASKLVEMFNRPAVIMSENGTVVKGSARSIAGVNITELLRSLKTPFLGLGGHEQAAGFSVEHSHVSQLKSELEKLANHTISDALLEKHHHADFELSLKLATISLAKMLTRLEPFGIGNPKPKFLFTDLAVVADKKLGSEGKHRKLTVSSRALTRELLLFNTKENYPLTHITKLIANLDINVWRDVESLQLIASYVET